MIFRFFGSQHRIFVMADEDESCARPDGSGRDFAKV